MNCKNAKSIFNSKMLELRITQFKLVEMRARSFLAQVGIEYNDLGEEEKFSIILCAAISSNVAEKKNETSKSKHNTGFGEQFIGFLKNVFPIQTYKTVYEWIMNATSNDNSNIIRNKLMDERGYSWFEAYLRTLSIAASSFAFLDKAEQAEESLYSFFLESRFYYE